MPAFRKKPIVIEAVQWFMPGDHPLVVRTDIGIADRVVVDAIWTLEGSMVVSPGDWIIKGVKGEHYPCKPDIFAATYDPA